MLVGQRPNDLLTSYATLTVKDVVMEDIAGTERCVQKFISYGTDMARNVSVRVSAFLEERLLLSLASIVPL